MPKKGRRTHSIKRGIIALIRRETSQGYKFVTVLQILDGPKFEHVAIHFLNLLELVIVLFGDLCEDLYETLQERVLNLLQEGRVLQCFARYV